YCCQRVQLFINMTKPNSRMEMMANTANPTNRLSTRNAMGWDDGICGAGRGVICLGLSHADSIVPTRMKPTNAAIISFGNLNTDMKTTEITIWIRIKIPLDRRRGAMIRVAHMGHKGDAASVRSRPHFGHFRAVAMQLNYSIASGLEQLTKVMGKT